MAVMKPSDINLEPVVSSLRSIKQIRSNVKDLFKFLADGDQSIYEQNGSEENTTNNDFLNDLQNLMNNINSRVRDLETSSALLTSSNIISSTNFGNAYYLGLDPNQDKQQLYNSMVQSYRRSDKLTDAACHSHLLLSSNSQKRSTWSSWNQRNRYQLRKALTTGYNVSSVHVENSISMVCKQWNIKVEFDHSFGEMIVLKIYLDRVLKAAITLRGYIIEWVNVKGIDEEFVDYDDRPDIWSESKYEVFRKVTEHTNSAMLHFASPLQSEVVLRQFLFWFKSYSTLFDKDCKKCGNKLKNFLPPTCRDLRTNDPYHDVCRPLKI